MKEFVLAGEAISIVFLLIILYGEIYEIKIKDETKKNFVSMLILHVFATFFDFICSYYEGHQNKSVIIAFSATCGFIFGYWVTNVYINYLVAFLNQKKTINSKKISKCFTAYTIIMSLSTLIMASLGLVFKVEDGEYVALKGAMFCQSYYIITLGFCLFLIFTYKDVLDKHDIGALLSFEILPFLTIIVNFFISEYTFSYIAVAISFQLIFVMLQAENEKVLRNREKILQESSHVDSLTGLMNRLAYEEACGKLDPNIDIGIVFGDINGLKYTNDNYGHKAGDELVKNFAELLRKCFRQEDIFRISGDEFVVVLPNSSEHSFDVRFKSLHSQLEYSERPYAAVGATHGKGKDILDLVNKAEEKMYSDKNIFYERFPEMKR